MCILLRNYDVEDAVWTPWQQHVTWHNVSCPPFSSGEVQRDDTDSYAMFASLPIK